MSLGFKRFMSSILAFVMMVSTFVVANVASVSAADGVTFAAKLNADELATGNYSNGDTLNEYFSVVTDSNTLTVDTSSSTFTVADSSIGEITVANRLKTGGSGSISKRAISFTTSSEGTVYVYAMSGNSNSADRYLVLSDGTTESNIETYDAVGTSAVTETAFTVEAGKTYYLYSNNSGINIYYIGSTATLVSSEVDDGEAEEESITFAATLNASNLTVEEYTADTVIGSDGYFKVLSGDDGNTVSVDENNKTFTVADGTSISGTQRIKLGGGGSTENRSIAFKTSTSGTVYVYAMSSSSSSADRYLVLSDGTIVTNASNCVATDNPNETAFTVEANTTYYLYSASGGINIYYIGSTAELVAWNDDVEDATEATTEIATETTTATEATTEVATEEVTEETTTAPSASGYVAMGTYELSDTYFGADESAEQSENIAAAKSSTGFTKDNITFKNLKSVENTHIRLTTTEGSTITFAVEYDCTLTITFTDANGVVINGGSYENQSISVSSKTSVINLYGGNTYTISAAGTANTKIKSLEFTAGLTEISTETTTSASEGSTEATTEEVTGNFPISISGNSSDVEITINGEDVTFSADGTYYLDVDENDEITFEFEADVARKIVGWSNNFDPDSYDSGVFTATATGEGITFTYSATANKDIDNSFITVTGSDEALNYGNYGYGNTKSAQTGATRAEEVGTLNGVSGVVTLREYAGGGYKTYDQRLILNDNTSTGVSFTASGDGYLIIDCGRGTPKVTIGGNTVTGEAIGETGKLGFDITEGDKVEIHKGSGTDSMQLKSVRFQSGDNVFEYVSGTSINISSLDSETKALLGFDTEATGTVVKFVGKLDTDKAAENYIDTDSIEAVGLLVLDAETVDGAMTSDSMFSPSNYTGSTNFGKLQENDALYDAIYDDSIGVKEDGEYAVDESTSLDDNVYYMLRYADLTNGTYYVFPYTVVSGIISFDGQFTSSSDLSAYKLVIE